MRKTLLVLSLLFSVVSVRAQLAVTYLPFQSFFSVSSNPQKLIWADLGVETNTFFANLNTEGSLLVNIKRGEIVNYYTGLGVNVNPFYAAQNLSLVNGYALKIGSRIKPFEKCRNVHFVFELSPYFNPQFDGGLLRTGLGVSYNFGQRKIE